MRVVRHMHYIHAYKQTETMNAVFLAAPGRRSKMLLKWPVRSRMKASSPEQHANSCVWLVRYDFRLVFSIKTLGQSGTVVQLWVSRTIMPRRRNWKVRGAAEIALMDGIKFCNSLDRRSDVTQLTHALTAHRWSSQLLQHLMYVIVDLIH